MTLEEQLSRLLSNDLDPEQAEALRARIREDDTVAAAWVEAQAVASDLDGLTLPELPADLVDAVLADDAPAAERSRRGWWLGAAGTLAAAAALLVALTPSPARIELGPGSHLIEGHALVVVGDSTATVDGRARFELVPGTPEEHMKPALIGAAAGALLTVSVYEGTARLSGPAGKAEVAAGETWSAPQAKGAAPVPKPAGGSALPVVSVATLDECRSSVEELSVGLEQAQMEAAFLRGQLATHEGDPVPWPEDVPEGLQPDNLEAAFAMAFEGIGTIVSMDCEEYPCIVVVDEGANPDPDAWKPALESIEGQLGGDINAMVGRSMVEDDDGIHALGTYAISAADAEPSPRTKFRMDQAMESFGEH
ncbi:MAG: hypothetical protein KC912_11800 [Proteobacteria bacterium]|nr:hypothetical protein [Pseudomonadota bacterium]